MISLKKLIARARKWKEMAGIGTRTISLPTTTTSSCKQAKAGHFVVYSLDKRRFVFPLAYLQTSILIEPFKWSEEEFGLPRDGPITLPLDAVVLEYVIQRHVCEKLEQALSLLPSEELINKSKSSLGLQMLSLSMYLS